MDRDVSPILVLADLAERCSGVPALIAADGRADVRLARLPVADYCIDGRILIERKRLDDLAQSIENGRLFRQAAALADSPLPGALLVEGRVERLAWSGVRREALQGALISLTFRFGVPILRSCDPAETARLLLLLGAQSRRWRCPAKVRRAIRRRPRGRHEATRAGVELLTAIPGIGPDRAERLMRAFGSIRSIATASPEEVMRVQGMGRISAASIERAFGDGKPGRSS